MEKIVFKDGEGGNEGQETGAAAAKVPVVEELTPEQVIALEKKEKDEAAAKGDGDKGDEGTTPPDNKKDIVDVDGVEYVLDDEGNALHEDGSVFKTKDELEVVDEGEGNEGDVTGVEIEGVEYDLNENGDAIDKDGVVKFTKDEITAMEDDTPEEATYDMETISNETAIVNYDEHGNPIKYENTVDGIKKWGTDSYNKGGEDAINDLLSEYPEVNGLINHLRVGNSLDTFNNTRPDYGKVKLAKDNEAQLKDIIYKAQSARGNRIESIDRYYESLKAGDTENDAIFEEAQVELKYMQDADKAAVVAQQAAIAQQAADTKANNDAYWGMDVSTDGNLIDLNVEDSVYGIIKAGVIKVNGKSFSIPKQIKVVENGKPMLKTAGDFLSYLRDPITVNIDGRPINITRDKLDLHNEQVKRTVGNDVFDAYRRFVNYDDTQLVTEQVNKSKVKTIRRLKSKNINKSGSTDKGSTSRVVFKKS